MPSRADLESAKDDVEWVRRKGFPAFVEMTWPRVESADLIWAEYIDCLCEWYTLLGHFKVTGLVSNVPPATGKSTIVQSLWPAWIWTFDPERRFVFSSYADGVLRRYGEKFLKLVSSDWWALRWPKSLVRPDASVLDLDNVSGGSRFAATVGGSNIGRHGHHWCGDDLLNPKDVTGRRSVDPIALEQCLDWLENVMPRSVLPGGNKSIIMQCLHESDPTQAWVATGRFVHIRRAMRAESAPCPVVEPHECVPDPREEGALLSPQYIDEARLAEMQADMSDAAIAAQHQQRPSPAGGGIIKDDTIRYWEKLPAAGGMWIQSWDCAFKDAATSDYVCGQVWMASGPDYYLVDQIWDRLDVLETCEGVLALRERWPKAVGIHIEDKANGPAVMQILRKRVAGLEPVEPKGGKVARARAVQPLYRTGNVYFPHPSRAPWVVDTVREITRFPGGAHDDRVDAMTQALLILHESSAAQFAEFAREMRKMAY